MPQLDLFAFSNQFFSFFILFVITYYFHLLYFLPKLWWLQIHWFFFLTAVLFSWFEQKRSFMNFFVTIFLIENINNILVIVFSFLKKNIFKKEIKTYFIMVLLFILYIFYPDEIVSFLQNRLLLETIHLHNYIYNYINLLDFMILLFNNKLSQFNKINMKKIFINLLLGVSLIYLVVFTSYCFFWADACFDLIDGIIVSWANNCKFFDNFCTLGFVENNIPQVPSSISYEQALVVGGCALVVGYLTYDFYTGGPLSSSIFSTNTLTHNYNMQNSSFHSGAVKSVLNSTLTHETLVSNNLDEMPVLQVLCPDLLNDPNVFNCTTSKSIEKDLFAMNKMSVEEPILWIKKNFIPMGEVFYDINSFALKKMAETSHFQVSAMIAHAFFPLQKFNPFMLVQESFVLLKPELKHLLDRPTNFYFFRQVAKPIALDIIRPMEVITPVLANLTVSKIVSPMEIITPVLANFIVSEIVSPTEVITPVLANLTVSKIVSPMEIITPVLANPETIVDSINNKIFILENKNSEYLNRIFTKRNIFWNSENISLIEHIHLYLNLKFEQKEFVFLLGDCLKYEDIDKIKNDINFIPETIRCSAKNSLLPFSLKLKTSDFINYLNDQKIEQYLLAQAKTVDSVNLKYTKTRLYVEDLQFVINEFTKVYYKKNFQSVPEIYFLNTKNESTRFMIVANNTFDAYKTTISNYFESITIDFLKAAKVRNPGVVQQFLRSEQKNVGFFPKILQSTHNLFYTTNQVYIDEWISTFNEALIKNIKHVYF